MKLYDANRFLFILFWDEKKKKKIQWFYVINYKKFIVIYV